MPRLPLTEEQKHAVGAGDDRLFIEAPPGAGKTTVAAERYGVLRFNRTHGAPGPIAAVSFTRSATGELHRRVRRRWGSNALSWPHRVTTIDSLVCNIIEHLLRQGVTRWPGGHTSLEVLDDWRGHRGYRWLTADSYRRVATIDKDGCVTSAGRRVVNPRTGVGSRADFHRHLEAGRCTHEEVRDVLAAILRNAARRQSVSEFLSVAAVHLVVDEVFDANGLDLTLVDLACEANIPVTLVGDPWQALYGFRGARPDLVPNLLAAREFASMPLSHSFRFQSQEMFDRSVALRAGDPVSVEGGSDYDVVLASQWDQLWGSPKHVLPVSFGRTTNKTDAAAIVLLDHLVYSTFNQHAIFLPEALILLGLDQDTYQSEGATVLGGVVEQISGSGDDAPVKGLKALREAMKDLGAARRPPSGTPENEQRQVDRLAALAARVCCGEPLVPGMTIHQAKGREWDFVGVRLTETEAGRLAAGLDQSVESDRALYVALTRAREGVRIVA